MNNNTESSEKRVRYVVESSCPFKGSFSKFFKTLEEASEYRDNLLLTYDNLEYKIIEETVFSRVLTQGKLEITYK